MGWEALLERPEHLDDPEWLRGVKEEFPAPAPAWMQLPMKDVIAEISSAGRISKGSRSFGG